MEFRPIERAADAFQQSVTPDQIEAMCRRAFGSAVEVASAVELGNGMYNNTYRVDLGGDRPVILRIAPEPGRQARSERELMRNEHASVPFLAPIAPMIPHTLAADFTHEIIGRDYLFQTMLDGIPAPDGIGRYPRHQWTEFFRQMGEIASRIHAVRGERFGPVAGPGFGTWSEAVLGYFVDLAADLDDAGLSSVDVREVAAAAVKHRAVLDEVTEPRLLHGDLWTVNVMMEPDTAEPRISGVFDNDRTVWGDPESDWVIYMAAKKPGTERDAFWETYGARPATPGAAVRSLFYCAKHTGAIRLERHRLGNTDAVPESYEQMRVVLDQLLRA
ncbi:phosphotransferase family protein [Saccharopolyspora sp. ASAGF58]|uniref:phosphotransferase family protein n=1 Tax=Saccharopolyspora sp. ASAGF58 TaxID=2719023 RepID=UPI0014402D1C|nr:aminoglycoside phosphotransferase family protein [Saccharopolyspora sp. ASAGF58]QIZ37037.1 aminoglycoside phosphotransferase family protein [Saccharopolyspora sp. ASAGF58]